MYEISFRVTYHLRKPGLQSKSPETPLLLRQYPYIGSEPPSVKAVLHASHFNIVAAAPVAAVYHKRSVPHVPHLLQLCKEQRMNHYGVTAGALELIQHEMLRYAYLIYSQYDGLPS